MLRECPLTHRCMTRVAVQTVVDDEGEAVSAVFLDRDGTIIEEVGYLDRRDRVELYPMRPTRSRR